MKRLPHVLASLFLVPCLIACGGSSSSEPAEVPMDQTPPPAPQPVVMLDQEFDPGGTTSLSSGVSGSINKAQTFTVGLTGTLTRVEVLINNDGVDLAQQPDLLFDIRPAPGGVPSDDDGSALFQVSIPRDELESMATPAFYAVELGALGFAVTAGDSLALVFRGADGNNIAVLFGENTNPYPDGEHFFRNPGAGITSWRATDVRHDIGFRTFVIPE